MSYLRVAAEQGLQVGLEIIVVSWKTAVQGQRILKPLAKRVVMHRSGM